jgi:hypothetical protein
MEFTLILCNVGGGINLVGPNPTISGDIYAPQVNTSIRNGANFTNSNAINVNSLVIESGATFNLTNGLSSSSSLNSGISLATGNALTNAGLLNIGTYSPTISGDFTQLNTGTFSTSIANQSSYGRLNVTGSASLSGLASVNVINPATALANQSTLVGIIRANTISGSSTQIDTNSSSYTFTGQYTGNEFNLLIGDRTGPGSNQYVNSVVDNNNPSAINAAKVLQAVANNPLSASSLAPVVDRLDASIHPQEVLLNQMQFHKPSLY